MSSITNQVQVGQSAMPGVPVYDSTCAWCLQEARLSGIVLPEPESRSHGICLPHSEMMLLHHRQRRSGRTEKREH
jgi:hypothetical protein